MLLHSQVVLLGAAASAASGHAGSVGYRLVIPAFLVLVMLGSAGWGYLRRRRNSSSRRDNPPNEPDGAKAQPPARPGPRDRGKER